MDKLIEELEEALRAMKTKWAKQQGLEYHCKQHKVFTVGDWVRNGQLIGVIEWNENKDLSFSKSDGYVGIQLMNDDESFRVGLSDNWSLVSSDPFTFYAKKHRLYLDLTGAEIYELKNEIGTHNANIASAKYALLQLLDGFLEGWEV